MAWFLQKQSTYFIRSAKQLIVMFEQISKLDCFTVLTSIEEVDTGLSSQCFRVLADDKAFFAKHITSPNEVSICIQASKQGISPDVYYHDQHWLISPFIDGKNLALSQQSTEQKITVAVKLMLECHKINALPTTLMPVDIINELIYQPHFSTAQQADLTQLAGQLIKPLSQGVNTVCCHGDLNFSNVLITAKSEALLIDFECACSAPIEYDLAMFIAVNNIENHEIAMVLQCYQQGASIPINHQLLNSYQKFCYFINSLWYLNRFQMCHQLTYKSLAEQQFNRLNKFQDNHFEQLLSRLGIEL